MTRTKKGWLRRGLSGIFLFDTLPQDRGHRQPTCIEDCSEQKRREFIASLDEGAMKRMAEHLNKTMRELWELLDDKERLAFGGLSPFCRLTGGKESRIEELDSMCRLIRMTGDMTGLCVEGSEAHVAGQTGG